MTLHVILSWYNPAIQDRPEDWGKEVGGAMRGLDISDETLTVGDLTDRLAETEAYLSRLTGLVVKIQYVPAV